MTYSGSRSSFVTFYPSITLKQHIIINLKLWILSCQLWDKMLPFTHLDTSRSRHARSSLLPLDSLRDRNWSKLCYWLLNCWFSGAQQASWWTAALAQSHCEMRRKWHPLKRNKQLSVTRPPPARPPRENFHCLTFDLFRFGSFHRMLWKNSACHSLCPQPAFVRPPSSAANSSERKWKHHPWQPPSPNTGATALLFTGNQWKSEG